jgi:hypothetical protein
MYLIKRDNDGVFFLCTACNHVERVKNFDGKLGSQRTQAAKAMNQHSQDHRRPKFNPRPTVVSPPLLRGL